MPAVAQTVVPFESAMQWGALGLVAVVLFVFLSIAGYVARTLVRAAVKAMDKISNNMDALAAVIQKESQRLDDAIDAQGNRLDQRISALEGKVLDRIDTGERAVQSNTNETRHALRTDLITTQANVEARVGETEGRLARKLDALLGRNKTRSPPATT